MSLEEIRLNFQMMFCKFVAFILLQVSKLKIALRLEGIPPLLFLK